MQMQGYSIHVHGPSAGMQTIHPTPKQLRQNGGGGGGGGGGATKG